MDKLQARFPELSQSELEFCALVKLNLSFKDIANLMNINHRSVFAKKYRITQKLKTSEDEDFYKIIREI
jgi:DNA-binding CsgD family transcriptional regulator